MGHFSPVTRRGNICLCQIITMRLVSNIENVRGLIASAQNYILLILKQSDATTESTVSLFKYLMPVTQTS